MAATYSILPSLQLIDEGQSLQTMIHTTGVINGTLLYWSIIGTNITAADFSAGGLSGQARVVNDATGMGMIMLSHTLANDLTTEGNETFQIKLFTDAARTKPVGTPATVTINDKSKTPAPVPTYAITPSAASLNEGAIITTTVQTTNVAVGTVLYWALSGTGITAADFSSGALSGSASVGATGALSFSHTLANDLTTEGVESLAIKLFTDAALTQQVGTTAAVTINDTSLTPPPAPVVPTYGITPSAASLNEGAILTTTVQTTNVAVGTLLYWSLSGTGIRAADFSNGALTGSAAVGATGGFSFSHTLANDLTTEGVESLAIKLFTDAALTQQVGTTATVTINDTSLTPAPVVPTYGITPSVASLNEGGRLTTRVQTTNVKAGTVLYWSLSGTGITAADFSSGALSGSAAVGATGALSFAHTLANDLTTEGAESLQVKLFSDALRTQQVGTTAVVTINDTSKTPAPVATYTITPSATALNEGGSLTTTVQTTNVAAATVLYWALSGTGITAADFSSGALTGSAPVGATGGFSFSHTLANDLTTEGAESLAIKLFSDAARTKQVGTTAAVTINDTSLTPPPASYMLMPAVTASNEGQVLTTMVHTANVPVGTVLYWALSGTGITAADFSSGALTGSFSATANQQFLLSHTLANDLTTEGVETLQITLFTDAARTVAVATTPVTINDTSTVTSTLPGLPTYDIFPSATTLSEGLILNTVVKTTNVPAGTSVYWRLTGTGITPADFTSGGALLGVATVGANGQFFLSHRLANDLTTEGTEHLQINLYGDPALSTLLKSATVAIEDTSLAPGLVTCTLTPSARVINEGDSITTTVTTANVPDGTIFFYQIRGANVDPQDFAVGALTGQVLIKGGKGAFTHILGKDLKTEGNEVLLIRLFSDQPGGIPISAPLSVTVKDSSVALAVATETYQPAFTPFAVKKWTSPVPVPTLKRPEFVGTQPEIWGPDYAPQNSPGGQPGPYQVLDPTQANYGGIAAEFYNQVIAGTSTPYFTTGQSTSWYSQREGARFQVVVDGVDKVYSTEIYGYDSTFPGSTFKTRVGQPVVVRHWNDLPAATDLPPGMIERESIHLHGGHNPAHADGYPSFVINPGMYRDYYYANTVPMGNDGKPDMGEAPSTMWYHDHGEDLTDRNVIKGMAGFWLSFDARELDLIKNHVLPGWWKTTAEWNEQEFMDNSSPYDIPLALTDRRFNADGSFFYDGFPVGPSTDGYLGDVMMVNGKSYPYLAVEPTQYRLRMLGASTARIWHLSIQDENGVMQPHLRVGNDTWLLPNPIQMNEFTISPAQRADTVMDFSGYAPGTVLYLVNTAEQHNGTGPQGNLLTIGTTGFSERIMKIVVGAKTPTTPTNTLTPATLLRDHTPILPSEITNHRTFEFGRSNGMWLINQTHYDSMISNNPIPLGVAEEWTLINGGGGWWHPIHIHLESHQVQTINGIKPGPDYFPEKQFKSDTTLLGPNTMATVFMKFRTFEGPFVFHCHNLQHEDSMMMFNFDPNLDGPTYKPGDPIPLDRNFTPFPFPSAHNPDPLTGPPNGVDPASTATGAPADISPLILSSFKYSTWGTIGPDLMQAIAQDSYLNGRDGNDTIQGGNGNDMLVGGAADDIITGGAGDDLVAGEFGNDTVTGGAGRDGFYFVTADPGSTDLITDFQAGVDFISLHHALTNTNGTGSPAATFIGAGPFTNVKGQVRFANSLLQVDLDGNGLSDINATLQGITTFDAAWLNVPTLSIPSTVDATTSQVLL
jgi:FtsP/CotA-like multicopper oxidase with cupredoxin domain